MVDGLMQKTFLRLIPSWVTPNQLTILRIIMTPFVIFLLVNENYVWGLVLFFFAMITDAMDGALARTGNMITDLGKIMDPFADKLLMVPVALIVIIKFSNPFIVLIIVLTESVLGIGGLYRKFVKKKNVQAETVGKLKVIFQSFALGFLMLYAIVLIPEVLVFAETLLYVSIFLGLLSLFSQKGI
jgi:CDP-diacylglycerol--glycerol-3-phosphate 3-phosphatidyltransferase